MNVHNNHISIFTKTDDGDLVSEASTLGWDVGEWPAAFVLLQDGGPSIIMQRSCQIEPYKGEFSGYTYISQVSQSKPHSTVARIFND